MSVIARASELVLQCVQCILVNIILKTGDVAIVIIPAEGNLVGIGVGDLLGLLVGTMKAILELRHCKKK